MSSHVPHNAFGAYADALIAEYAPYPAAAVALMSARMRPSRIRADTRPPLRLRSTRQILVIVATSSKIGGCNGGIRIRGRAVREAARHAGGTARQVRAAA